MIWGIFIGGVGDSLGQWLRVQALELDKHGFESQFGVVLGGFYFFNPLLLCQMEMMI